MKNKHYYLALFLFISIVSLAVSCQQNNPVDSSGLYVPTASDTTATASLVELQEGRVLFIDNCGACHSLYSPDSFTPTQWKSVLNKMAPKTSLSASQVLLVTKYVSRGLQ